jgi:hypothetical protein
VIGAGSRDSARLRRFSPIPHDAPGDLAVAGSGLGRSGKTASAKTVFVGIYQARCLIDARLVGGGGLDRLHHRSGNIEPHVRLSLLSSIYGETAVNVATVGAALTHNRRSPAFPLSMARLELIRQ